MEDKASIPCSACNLWDSNKNSFSCDPSKCERLTEWLMKLAAVNGVRGIQYIV